MGSTNFCFDPCSDHGTVVLMIIQAGGVPFIKSNVPQLLLVNETNNWIWGRSANPWDTNRSTGGSSGGEAGLVAMGCSPIGVGSDGGGSVRIPANYCGIYGIRPTAKRFTLQGHRPPSSYTPRHIFGCMGPLAKSIDDCERMLESLQNSTTLPKFDPALPSFGWHKDTISTWQNKKLRIGLIRNYSLFNTFKGQKRVMDDVVSAMRAQGHEIIDLEIDEEVLRRLMFSFIS